MAKGSACVCVCAWGAGGADPYSSHPPQPAQYLSGQSFQHRECLFRQHERQTASVMVCSGPSAHLLSHESAGSLPMSSKAPNTRKRRTAAQSVCYDQDDICCQRKDSASSA